MGEKLAQILEPECNAASRGRKAGPCHVDENAAATAGDARARVVVDLDQEVVEVVIAPQPIAWFTGRPCIGAIVPAIGWILAPGVGGAYATQRQQRSWPGKPVGPPPDSNRAESPARGAAIAFTLVCPDAGATQGNAQAQRSRAH